MAVLGIDLGKAQCSVTLLDGSNMHTVTVEPVVAVSARLGWLVGEEARLAVAKGTAEGVWDLIELLGRKMSDFTVAQTNSWAFRLVQGQAGKAFVEFQTTTALPRSVFAPEELLAVLIANLRRRVEQESGCIVEKAVLTIPVCFTHLQRQALRDSCEMAGMFPLRLVVSSTAAGVAFVSERVKSGVKLGRLLLVVDFGASSVSVSLLAFADQNKFEVKAVTGDSNLGGVTLTNRIFGFFLPQVSSDPFNSTHRSIKRLQRASQLAKKILSKSNSASIALHLDSGHVTGSITQDQFEAVCFDCWKHIETIVRIVLDEGHVMADQVNHILLCGGSSVIGKVKQIAEKMFPGRGIDVCPDDPFQSLGAALLCRSLSNESERIELLDVLPLELGVNRAGTKDAVVLIQPNVRLPAHGDKLLFAHNQLLDRVYRVLEGRDLRTSSATATLAAHTKNEVLSIKSSYCIGTVRLVQAPTISIVAKLTIAFEVDENLQLKITLVDLGTKRSVKQIFYGDDTILSRDVVKRATVELDALFGDHRRAHGALAIPTHNIPPQSDAGRVPVPAPPPSAALAEYACKVAEMLRSGKVEVRASEEERLRLSTKLDAAMTWLRSTASGPETPLASHAIDPHASNQHNEDEAAALLVALRRAHLGAAAACAIAQLRHEDV